MAWISHGEVIEALGEPADAPAPLGGWRMGGGDGGGGGDGIEPHLLNDDRIARALAVAPQLDEITGCRRRGDQRVRGGRARLHWDMTSISLYGAYSDPDGEYPRRGGGIRRTAARTEANPERAGSQRGWRHPGVPPRL